MFALQALTRVGDERPVVRNAAPLLDKPLDDGVLPEVFPTQLMASDTTRSLQHELLTFQVGPRCCDRLSSQRAVCLFNMHFPSALNSADVLCRITGPSRARDRSCLLRL